MINNGYSNRCTYCLKVSGKLIELPKELKDTPGNRYCPKCYPGVLEDTKNLPWNRDLWKKKT